MPPFDREKVFAAVDESSKRFNTYSEEDRKKFRDEARRIRESAEEDARISANNMMVAAIICTMS